MSMLKHYIRDSSRRTEWGCYRALLLFAIDRSTTALMRRWSR